MTCKAMCLCHVDARASLRGKDVKRGALFIFTIYIIYKVYRSIIGRQFINLDGYYVAYKPITLSCILFMFIKIHSFIVILV